MEQVSCENVVKIAISRLLRVSSHAGDGHVGRVQGSDSASAGRGEVLMPHASSADSWNDRRRITRRRKQRESQTWQKSSGAEDVLTSEI